MTSTSSTSPLVRVALEEADRNDRFARWAILGAATLEAVLLVVSLTLIDWGDPSHKLMFVLALLTYSTLALGLVALAARASAAHARILKAVQLLSERQATK